MSMHVETLSMHVVPLSMHVETLSRRVCVQEQGYSPLQALADAVPQAGVPKYDFLRNILKTAAQHRDSQAADDSKYNPLQALSRAFANFEEPTGSAVPDLDPWGNLMQQVRDPSTYARSKYDPFHQLFNAQGPAAEAPELDPLGPLLAALRQPWSRPPSSKYDVFQAIFSLQGPSLQAAPLDPLGAALRDGKQPWQSVNSKYDPVQAFFTFAAQSPTGDAPLDPLPGFFRAVTQSSPQVAIAPQGGSPAQGPLSQRLEKYIPLRQLFSSMAGDAPTGPTPGFDPVGSLLKSAWLKETRRLGVPRQLPAPENADYPASDFEQAYSRRRQAGKDPQQEMASLMQQRATRPQPPGSLFSVMSVPANARYVCTWKLHVCPSEACLPMPASPSVPAYTAGVGVSRRSKLECLCLNVPSMLASQGVFGLG